MKMSMKMINEGATGLFYSRMFIIRVCIKSLFTCAFVSGEC